MDELLEAQADASAWSDTRIEIEAVYEGTEGSVIVQSVHSGVITGSWRTMEAKGQPIRVVECTVFKFDDDDLIIHEEAYYDMVSVRKQFGYE